MATLEQIDKLRERANVSYEEAKEAMTLCDDDFLSALIYLEKSGKVKPENNTRQEKPAQQVVREWQTPPPWQAKSYSYTYHPYYDSKAWRFNQKMQQKVQKRWEKAQRWAYKDDRRVNEASEAAFWNEFWYGVRKFARIVIQGVCILPIMFFATLAALFTKFTLKVERKDGKDVPFNGTLEKIAKFADDVTGYATSPVEQSVQENATIEILEIDTAEVSEAPEAAKDETDDNESKEAI